MHTRVEVETHGLERVGLAVLAAEREHNGGSKVAFGAHLHELKHVALGSASLHANIQNSECTSYLVQ